MKVWIVCALLCGVLMLRTAAAAAIETGPEQDQKLAGETSELAVVKLIDAVEYKDETLKADVAEGNFITGETTELAAEELTHAVEDMEEPLKADATAKAEENDEPLKADATAKVKSVYCPSGWVKYGLRCFRLMRSSMSWINAEAQCANVQARLASVHSLGEYNFLQSVLDMAGLSQAWIGAYYFQGTWLWVDTTRFSYTNWYSVSSVSSYPCVFMRNNVGWSNTNCGYGYAYFCAIDLNTC